MEVLKDNFEGLLPAIQEAINGCDLIAIDTELTGLHPDAKQQLDYFDTHQERYTKVRESARKFLIVQLGVCPFTWDAQTQKYIARPFNFYLFPSVGTSRNVPDKSFLCQASSLEFLFSHGFDFNKWIGKGIPYMNRKDEENARIRIENQANIVRDDIPIDDKNRPFIEDFKEKVTNWMQNSADRTLFVQAGNGYLRRLVHQEIRKMYNGFVATDGNSNGVELTRLTEEEKRERAGDKGAQSQKDLSAVVGLRKVFDMIGASKKPICGHNMLLDVCQIFQQFYGELPERYEDFKRIVHTEWPCVFDTKKLSMATTQLQSLITSSVLADLFGRVKLGPFMFPNFELHAEFREYEENTSRFHEAGFDSYCTGVAFLRMAGLATQAISSRRLDFSNPTISDYENKLYLMRSDIPFFNLGGHETMVPRSDVYYIYDFPNKWRTNDILENLQKLVGPLQVRWIDSTSCFVIVQEWKRLIRYVLQCRSFERAVDELDEHSMIQNQTPRGFVAFCDEEAADGQEAVDEDEDVEDGELDTDEAALDVDPVFYCMEGRDGSPGIPINMFNGAPMWRIKTYQDYAKFKEALETEKASGTTSAAKRSQNERGEQHESLPDRLVVRPTPTKFQPSPASREAGGRTTNPSDLTMERPSLRTEKRPRDTEDGIEPMSMKRSRIGDEEDGTDDDDDGGGPSTTSKGVVKRKHMRFDADGELAEEEVNEIEYDLDEERKERRRRHRERRENDSSNRGHVDESEGGQLDGEDESEDGNKETKMPESGVGITDIFKWFWGSQSRPRNMRGSFPSRFQG
ncbi:ribonuclease H-like domain-containing protein [Cladochytrium replicatum]|nr:ribonuclease H-like domain-containing protein [Cladochytrium replicatum]